MNRFTTTLMISALALGSQLANAATTADPPTVTVRFTDLDLTHSQGITVLYLRLKDAAGTVCARLRGRDLVSQIGYKICWQSALGTAVAKVNQPALTTYYRSKIGSSNGTIQIARK